ncbi:MAG: TetR/AcrR family transcriptional regulator [Caulobacterales bacterium]|uniref:TetR/AcrR family transcriptional regulator n=1 Tax=Glycocaulis sp. TaxID=1969725 RepID=UPI003F9F1DAA
MTTNRWISDLHWRRDSQQSRSEQTQSALLDAAEALIVEQGAEGASITRIAERAGVSVGAVYHHFKDKKALCYAVFQRVTDALSDLNRQAADPARWQGARVRDLLEGYIDLRLHASATGNVSKHAAALLMANDAELKAHMAEIKREGNLALLGLILARREEIGHPDPDFAARFVIDQLGAMITARTDPYQTVSAIAACDDAAFKAEALDWAAHALRLGE